MTGMQHRRRMIAPWQLALLALAFGLCAVCAGAPVRPVYAQAPGQTAAANAESPQMAAALDRMMEAGQIDSLFDQMVTQFLPAIAGPLAALNPEASEELNAIVLRELQQGMAVNKPVFIAAMRAVYRQRFTAAELDQISAFLGSDVGRKMSREQIGIATEMAQVGQTVGLQVMQSAMPRIIEQMRKSQLKIPDRL